MGDLWRLGAGELAQMISRREVTSVEVVDAHLARIDAVNPALNAITEVLADRARQEATAADARSPTATRSARCTACRSP